MVVLRDKGLPCLVRKRDYGSICLGEIWGFSYKNLLKGLQGFMAMFRRVQCDDCKRFFAFNTLHKISYMNLFLVCDKCFEKAPHFCFCERCEKKTVLERYDGKRILKG